MCLQRVKICLLALIPTLGFALASDKEQVMHVAADSAKLSQQERRGTYNGHVEFTQGTTHIRAAFAITEASSKNQLSLAKAQGNNKEQAHYWTKPSADKPEFHAYADTISYYPLRHLIELKGNARILQGDDSMSAALIQYDTEKQRVITQSDGNNRTLIIFHPKKLSP